jgi:IS5 family transposase
MKQGKKNRRERHFGVKAHVGTDVNGLVHTPVTTHAGASDFNQLQNLLHGQERELYGDQAGH